ncbi:MAG: hypothetical protein M9921_08000 [Fimbriimonadaceae bacterium]|nr:hypothetical protein [Chthonomonadaceae bacterium]MCO5296784.1 hypothetical protein [Fimbriimonadaceae bacterium]
MKSSFLLLALAALAVGCGTGSQPPSEGSSAAKSEPNATVAQKEGTDSTAVTGAQATAEPAAPEAVKPGEQTPAAAPGEAKPTPPANGAAPAPGGRAPQAGAGGPGPSANNARGGPGGGGPRGGGRGFNVGMMLRNEQFQKELKLTDDQVKKIEAALPQQGQGGGGQQMSPEERAKQRAEIQAKVEAILKPEQTQRLREIELQMQGPRALTRDNVAKDLGLSADQTKKIEAALQVPRPQGGGGAAGAAPRGGGAAPGAPGAGGPGGGFDREAFMKAREEANKKALAILTPAQKAKWEKMLGKPFVFQRPQGGPGGGGPGGPPRGGGQRGG